MIKTFSSNHSVLSKNLETNLNIKTEQALKNLNTIFLRTLRQAHGSGSNFKTRFTNLNTSLLKELMEST